MAEQRGRSRESCHLIIGALRRNAMGTELCYARQNCVVLSGITLRCIPAGLGAYWFNDSGSHWPLPPQLDGPQRPPSLAASHPAA